jgi:hypothetical protein
MQPRIVFGMAAFKGWFRSYSAATALVLLVPAIFSNTSLRLRRTSRHREWGWLNGCHSTATNSGRRCLP